MENPSTMKMRLHRQATEAAAGLKTVIRTLDIATQECSYHADCTVLRRQKSLHLSRCTRLIRWDPTTGVQDQSEPKIVD
jgi:hypothetical protein